MKKKKPIIECKLFAGEDKNYLIKMPYGMRLTVTYGIFLTIL